MTIKRYSEIIELKTFEDRFNYLKLNGEVGVDTFGFDRYLNQKFYKSRRWLSIRDEVIVRDNGCDLGVIGYDIYGKVIIHHMNPITIDDIKHNSDFLINTEFLICTTFDTHQAIHYGDDDLKRANPVERTKNDTCPWKQ